MIPWKHPVYSQIICLVLAFGFMLLSLVALLWPIRPIRRFGRRAVLSVQPGEVQTDDEAVVDNQDALPPAYAN
jgi:hypothetical protein